MYWYRSGSAYGYADRLEKELPEIIPISTLVLPLVVEFHRNIARHWLKFNFEPRMLCTTCRDGRPCPPVGLELMHWPPLPFGVQALTSAESGSAVPGKES